MIQQTTVVYRVVLSYDDEKLDEHVAQDLALQEFPDQFGRGRVEVHFVERVAGGVDADGVANQPEVRKVVIDGKALR